MGTNITLDEVAGVAISGVLMFNAVQLDNTDPFYPAVWTGANRTMLYNATSNTTYASNITSIMDRVDKCLGVAYNNTGIYHYHIMSPCLYDPSIPGGQCSTDNVCKNNFTTYAVTGFDSNETLKAIGMAKDGHVIYGPYNPYGNLYTCDDLDMCNGRIMEDGSYAYLATQTYPYFVGCWGPAPQPVYFAECSTNTCKKANFITMAMSSLLIVMVAYLVM